MTARTKVEAEMEMFPVLKNDIFCLFFHPESESFTTEVPLPFDEKYSTIFFAKSLCFFDKDGALLVADQTGRTGEEVILELLSHGKKVTQIVRIKDRLLQLYVVPEGCDSVADIMIPLLSKERQEARDSLVRKVARLYPTKEEKEKNEKIMELAESLKKRSLCNF